MTTAIDITPEHRKILLALLRRFIPGVAVWAYGSRVKWTARPNSDLDLVAFAIHTQNKQVSELKEALAESNLPFSVDFHIWDEVPEKFHDIIRKEYVVVQEAGQAERGKGMAGEWPIATLGDGPLEIIDGDRGTNYPKQQDFAPTGHCLFLNTGNVTTNGFNFSDCMFIPAEKDAALRKGKLRRHDVVLTTRGTVGNVAYFDESIPYEHIRINSGMVILRAQPKKLRPRFLYLYLRSLLFRTQVESLRTGSAQPQLPIRDINRVEIPVPPLNDQDSIAHILGTLDDKIELNQRMNETLEAMARALFKSWFVDFDPVHAKAEGCDPGLPKPLADLFPDSLEDSELGEIPNGWEVGKLSDFATLNPEAWTKDSRPLAINYVDLSNTKWGRIEEVTTYTQKEAPSRAQRVLRPNDTIVGTVRPGNGSYALISQDDLTASTGFAVLRPLKVEYAEFVYLAATVADNIDRLAHLADGAAYPAVRPEVVAATQVSKVSDRVIERFAHITRPLLAKVAENEYESRTLAALRDTLLPKLISGELRVKDAGRDMDKIAGQSAGINHTLHRNQRETDYGQTDKLAKDSTSAR